MMGMISVDLVTSEPDYMPIRGVEVRVLSVSILYFMSLVSDTFTLFSVLVIA